LVRDTHFANRLLAAVGGLGLLWRYLWGRSETLTIRLAAPLFFLGFASLAAGPIAPHGTSRCGAASPKRHPATQGSVMPKFTESGNLSLTGALSGGCQPDRRRQ
jgi:hypothetical protein